MIQDLLLVTKISMRTLWVFAKKNFADPSENPISTHRSSARVSIDGIVVRPGYINLLYFLDGSRRMGRHLKRKPNVSDYIQLSRFIDKDNMDRISCDWCSIVNGYIELLLEAIKGEDAASILKTRGFLHILTQRSLVFLSHIPGSVVTKDYKCPAAEVERFIQDHGIRYTHQNKTQLTRYIQEILDTRNICAQIESSWCPIAYLEKMKYEREYWGTDIQQLCDTLSRLGKVNCKECIKDLNRLHGRAGIKPSIFEVYLRRIQSNLGSTLQEPEAKTPAS